MKGKLFFAIFIVLSCGFAQMAVGATVASSTFDSGLDGWEPTAPSETSWVATGGNPGGYVRVNDNSGSSGQITAPQRFLGDWSLLDGSGSITFDHQLFSTGAIDRIVDYEINISGTGGSAKWTSPGPSDATDWLSFTALIDESSWDVTGSWSSLIASVTELRIRIEMVDNGFSSNRDMAGVDNISLNSVPLPPSLFLLASGLLAVVGVSRKKK